MGRKGLLFVLSIVVLLAAACAREAPTPAPGATSASPAPPAAAASPPPPAASAKPEKLRMAMPGEPASLDLTTAATGSALAEPIVFNVMEPLVQYTKDGPVPGLATKWESSPDLTKWRFYLRKGVKFHNGADFSARDVVEFVKWNIEVKSYLLDRVPVKEAVAVDDYTVDLIFEGPQPLLTIRGRAFLIPPVAISRDNREKAKTLAIGTGPYRLVEWNKGLNIKLTRFEGYWGPKPQIDEVEIIFRAESGVRQAALLAGEVDWAYGLSPEQASNAPKVVRMPSPETAWIRFDESVQKDWTKVDPIFADKRLRLAVEYAIDRQKLVTLYGGFATPSLGQLASPGDFGFNPDLKSRPYDLERARALVREAGAVGKTVTQVAISGRWSKDREVAEAVANMIEQTGLKVKITPVSYEEWVKYSVTTGENRQYMSDLAVSLSDAVLEVESRYRVIFDERGGQFALNDLEPTRLYKEEQAESDYAKREEKLAKASAYVYEEAHYVPLFKPDWIWGTAKNLEWHLDVAGRPLVADMRFIR